MEITPVTYSVGQKGGKGAKFGKKMGRDWICSHSESAHIQVNACSKHQFWGPQAGETMSVGVGLLVLIEDVG